MVAHPCVSSGSQAPHPTRRVAWGRLGGTSVPGSSRAAPPAHAGGQVVPRPIHPAGSNRQTSPLSPNRGPRPGPLPGPAQAREAERYSRGALAVCRPSSPRQLKGRHGGCDYAIAIYADGCPPPEANQSHAALLIHRQHLPPPAPGAWPERAGQDQGTAEPEGRGARGQGRGKGVPCPQSLSEPSPRLVQRRQGRAAGSTCSVTGWARPLSSPGGDGEPRQEGRRLTVPGSFCSVLVREKQRQERLIIFTALFSYPEATSSSSRSGGLAPPPPAGWGAGQVLSL